MSVNTHGLRLKNSSPLIRHLVELLSAMRFAIALLAVICIASVIGTILKQQEPYGNYVNQFGPFWASLFAKLGLFSVYSAWWFLLILLFLVISTSVCVARHVPQILRELPQFKEKLRESSRKAFAHNALWDVALPAASAAAQVQQALAGMGWRVKLKQSASTSTITVAAKAGAGHKIGYIAAHSAVVLICLGGLLDGELLTRAQMSWGGKVPFTGGGMIADVPPQSRLPATNPAFRANLFVGEGQTSNTAVLQQPSGVLIQELPFAVELKKFVVEYYSTGMPKLFASDIVIHDKATGSAHPMRVEVNHPVQYQGINIFQSSFDDGGSKVHLRSIPLVSGAGSMELEGTIGSRTKLTHSTHPMSLEYVALRVLNVETMGKKELRNVGPSITYKLRDAAGQAREFHNYMMPIKFPDSEVTQHLIGVRDTPAQEFRYWRIPSDREGKMDGFLRLMRATQDPALTQAAIERYLDKAVDSTKPQMREALRTSSTRVMALFRQDGLQGIAEFLEKNVPETNRDKTSDVLIRILNGVLYELTDSSVRDQPEWINLAVLALTDAKAYPAPMIFELKDFTQVQASVFQVTKAPGQKVVYLGAVLLIVGVFFMLFIRERRVWVWISSRPMLQQANGTASTAQMVQTENGSAIDSVQIGMAYTSNRKTMQSDQEFEQICRRLKEVTT